MVSLNRGSTVYNIACTCKSLSYVPSSECYFRFITLFFIIITIITAYILTRVPIGLHTR